MDLDSPFLKTALIEGRDGKMDERVIRKAKLVGDRLEMETETGGLALFPKSQVAAILPRLPTKKVEYGVEDVEGVLAFLQKIPSPFRDRPEAGPEVLEKWRAMLAAAEEQEVQRAEQTKKKKEEQKREDVAKVEDWISDWADFRKSRTVEEIQALRARGQVLLQEAPEARKTVEEGLAFLAQWQARSGASPLPDLEKLDAIKARMAPQDLLGWVGMSVWVVSFFGLLAGLGLVSSGLNRWKEGAWLGGLLFLPTGVAILVGVASFWWPMGGIGTKVEPGFSPVMERLGFAAKNSVQPVFFLPAMNMEAGGEELAAGLLAILTPWEEPVGPWRVRFQSGTGWLGQGSWTYRQSLTVLGLPLPLAFTFAGATPPLAEWRQPEAQKIWLGRVLLPGALGEMLFQSVLASWDEAAEGVGLGRLKMEKGQAGKIRILFPASGKKPVIVQEAKAEAVAYRKKISAEDLAQAFVDGQGGEFAGKFVLLDGVVEKVSSGSEYSGGARLGDSASGQPQKMGPDRFDVLYLRGADRQGPRGDPLFIRCVIRSPLVFTMDSYGDLFLGPAVNPVQDKPVVKKGYRVKFTQEGRVQSREIKNNEIEVYGIDVSSAEELIPYDPTHAPPP